jgi:hypothetical protein
MVDHADNESTKPSQETGAKASAIAPQTEESGAAPEVKQLAAQKAEQQSLAQPDISQRPTAGRVQPDRLVMETPKPRRNWSPADWFGLVGLAVNAALLFLTFMLVRYTISSLDEGRQASSHQVDAVKESTRTLDKVVERLGHETATLSKVDKSLKLAENDLQRILTASNRQVLSFEEASKTFKAEYTLMHSQYEQQLALQSASPRLVFTIGEVNKPTMLDWAAFAAGTPLTLENEQNGTVDVAFVVKNVGNASLVNPLILISTPTPDITLSSQGCQTLSTSTIQCSSTVPFEPFAVSATISQSRVRVEHHVYKDVTLRIHITGQNGNTGRAAQYSDATARLHLVPRT